MLKLQWTGKSSSIFVNSFYFLRSVIEIEIEKVRNKTLPRKVGSWRSFPESCILCGGCGSNPERVQSGIVLLVNFLGLIEGGEAGGVVACAPFWTFEKDLYGEEILPQTGAGRIFRRSSNEIVKIPSRNQRKMKPRDSLRACVSGE